MLSARVWLVALILTEGEAVFVDSDGDEEAAPASDEESAPSDREPTEGKHAESGEGADSAKAEQHAEKGGTAAGQEAGHSESGESANHSEGNSEEVFGVDAEATPFVVLAVLASLALALAAWARPSSTPILVVVALAMLAFAVFDVREVFHQADESKTGLAVLAGIVAALHLAAAFLALRCRDTRASSPRRRRRR
jgi:hypothetical protein